MFEIIVWLNKSRILSVFLRINARSYKNYKMLQLPTKIHNFKHASFKLENSIYIFD